MVKEEKYLKGHLACKKLEGGEHEESMKIRIALNKICDTLEIVRPEELVELNELFDN